MQLGGDARQAPALGAQLDKLILRLLIFHHFLSPGHRARLLISRTRVRDDLIKRISAVPKWQVVVSNIGSHWNRLPVKRTPSPD